jgi:hypothetical protein
MTGYNDGMIYHVNEVIIRIPFPGYEVVLFLKLGKNEV